jgi:hypothetical protein
MRIKLARKGRTGLVSIGDALKWQIDTIRECIHQFRSVYCRVEPDETLAWPFHQSARFLIEVVPPSLPAIAHEVIEGSAAYR